jgi:hypothetical protein
MANFNGLRPPRTRPAGTGRLALAAPAPLLLLAFFAALAAAFFLFQLAGSTGTAEAPRFPAFLAEALGAPQAEAPLARKPARGVSVAIRDDGYRVAAKDGSVSLASQEAGEGQWRAFANGASRPTAFGAETIVVEPRKTEQYLTVTSRQGAKTWTWQLATTLEPRLAKDGGVDFVVDGGWHEAHKHYHGPRLAQYRIAPVAIFDAQGNDVTPAGLRWSLAHRGSSWWLELRLDDSKIPLPYVIDPAIVFRGGVGSSNNNATTVVMNMPSGVVANDFLIAQITTRGGTGTTITEPAGWTILRRDDNGTDLAQAIYYKVAGSSEPASYTWNLSPSVKASGGIIAYTGVDNADPFDAVGSAGGNSSLVTAPTITTSENNAMLVGFFGIANCNNGVDYWTPPLGMTERYDVNSVGGGAFSTRTNSTGTDVVQALAGPTGPKSATAESSAPWIAQLVALRLDVTPPAAPVQTVTESIADSHASGSTFYYRPAGAGGSFTVTAATNDGTPTQSGINKVNLPGLAGGFTPTLGLDDTASPYEQTYSWTTAATESGTKTVTATDNAGNTNTGTFTITPDSAAPTTSDNTASIGSGWKNTNQTVILTPSDGSGSGTATTYYTTDGSVPTTASPQGTSVSLTSDGSFTVKYFSVDNVGNSEAPVTAGTVINIDKTNPTSATLDPLPGAIRNGQVLTGAATDGGPSGIASIAYYYCAGPPCSPSTLIGSSSTGPSYSVTWSSQPADGDYEVLARASDNAGNTLDSSKRTVTIDNTAPETTITASPSDPDNDPDPSFSFTSSEAGSSFECKLDAGAFAACTSPKSYTGLSAGSHTFEVKATDAAGNVDPSPASHTWTIDLTDPETTITGSPSDPDNDPDPSFSFTSSEAGSTFECKLDAGAFAACTSPKSYTGLSEGSHTFEVKATDAAGNVDPTPASYTWTIDLTDPDTTITASPSDPDNDADPSFSFTSSEAGSSFECKLDAGAFAACTSPKSYTGLAAGSHTFEVKAIDAAGNTDPTPAAYTWTIDLTDPNTTITASPPDPDNDPDPSFSFTSSEAGSTFECKLDAGAFASCTSPKAYTGLSAGSHTFEVKATDAAGNTDPTPATHTWTIDLTDPNTTITGSPPDPDNDPDPSFSFTSSEAGSTFECKLDAGAFATCTSPKAYTGLAAGSHTFEAVATDAAGNVDPTPASYTWTIDLTDPNTSITASPSDPDNDPDPSFSFTSSEAGSSFECKLDAGAFAACTSPKSYTGLSAGSHTFEVKATDPAGNTDPTPASFTWTIDLTDPPAPSIDPPSPSEGSTTGEDVDFHFSDSEAGVTFTCAIDGGAFTSCTSPKSYTGLSEGSHTFEVKATDAANNDSAVTSRTWNVDGEPDTTITANPSDPSNDADPSFSFVSSDPGSTFECKLDAGAFASCTSPKSYAGLSAGSHTFDVRAIDPENNTDPTPASYTWTIDLTDPQTTIDSSPADPTNATGASFTFSSSEAGSTFECELDGGGFSSCASPKSYSGLAAGSHTFRVVATDAAGNVDPSPASFTWMIDLTDPNTTITASPSDPDNDADPSFSFTSSEAGSTFECKLDAGAFASCTSPKSYTGLAAGSHTFEVKATDAAGNTDPTPASYTWTIDLTDPNTTITANPSDPSNDADPSFSFTSSEAGSSFECKLDAGAFASCTSPKSYTGLAAGSHTFEVKATDAAGNVDPTPASFSWTIDLTDPNTTITASPSDPSNEADPSFSFTSSEAGSTFECKLDAGAFAACTSPKSYTGLTAGSHTFEVKATDAAGNTDATPAAYTWMIDLTDPNTSITASPSDPSNEADPSFSFTSSEAGSSFECKLDAGAFASCTSPKSYTGLAAGSHTFEVKATDAAGNTDPTPASHTWTIDLTDPNTTITASPSDPSNEADPSFSFTSSEAGSTFECKLDAGAFASCTSPKSYTGLSAGSHTFEVKATDAAGNVDPTPASYTWTIDLTDPNTTITASPSDPDNDADPSFSFSSSEAGSTFECKLDAGAFASCTSPKSYTGLAAGSHTFEVKATDAAGNVDPTPASYTWTIDLIDPNTTITASPSDPDNDADPSISFTSSEAGSTFECKLDAGAFAPCTSPKSYTSLAAGSHTFEVVATDAAGNVDPTPASHTWTIDLTDPNTSITASPSDPSNDADPSFSFNSSESGSSFECKLDAGAFAACTSPKSYTGLAGGSHTFEVKATDAAGNTDATPATHTWTIDLTDPNTTITASPADPSNDADPSFSFTSSESGSTFECKLDAGAFAACTSPKSYTGLAGGSHTFEVKATDAAGNTDTSPASHTWTIDLTDPQTAIDSSPADPTNVTGASFDFSSSEAGSTFQCQLDGAGFSTCTSPESYSGLGAGSHTFEVKATDAAGNTDATPASYTWTIDLTDPDTTITAAPSDPSNNEDPSFSFSSSEAGSSFECKLDAGAFAACTSPQSYTGLTGGSHTFEVKATDAAGNTDATPASHAWTIDLSPPSVNIDSAPSDPSPDTTPTFEFSASEAGSTFECELDGSGFSPCASPATYGPLGDGNHSFGVRATDPAGNPSSPATYSWLLNSGSPTVSITTPTGFVNAADADPFTVTATTPDGDVTNVGFFRCDDSSIDCATGSWILLGNDPSAPYSAPWPVDADGNRALRAVATDVGSNTGADVVNVTIDRTLPVTTIGSGPADPSTSPNASFGFSAEPGASFACRLDGGSFASCTSPHSYTGLGDGVHVFEVRATDAAGNVEAVPPTYGWTIDTAAPQTTITVNPSDPTSSGSADFEFTSSEAGSTFLCELDGAGFSACASPQGYTGLADGSHTFKVKAVDPAGNPDPSASTYTWLVDATDPNGGLSDPGSPLRATVNLTATPNDDGAGVKEVEFQYSPANAGSWTAIAVDDTDPFTTTWDTTVTGDGLYDLRVVITDNALNSTPSTEVEDRLVDNTDPSATMTDPGAYLRGTVALSSSADDGPSGSGIATVAYQRSPANAGTWTTVPQNWDTTSAADGLYDLRVVATDNAGNSAASAPVEDRMVDNTKPGLSSSTPADGSTVDFAASVSVTGSEALAGIAGATIDGAAAPPPVVSGATVTYPFLFADGPHTLAGELEDLAGNRTAIRIHFTVWSLAAADYPYTEKNSYTSADSSLAAADFLSEVTVPLGAWSGAALGDWLVIRIDPRPFGVALPSGFEAGSDILDVTAYWALAGTEVHDFTKPLDIRVGSAASNALPAVLEGSAWRILVQVTGTTLPSAQQDGFYRDGTDVHILTRHLSSFALLRDVQNPSKPRNFRGSNSNGRLVLRWDAATDNSGLIGSYAVYANGVKIKTRAATARSVDLGRFKTTDARKFRMRAYDAAGNASKLTYKLAIVPAVKNLTLTDAKSRLVKRGFQAGTLKRAYSSSIASGRVISAGKSGLVRTGTGISLTVSLGSANRASTSAGTGTSGPTSGFTPQAPPAPSSSTGGAPQPPPSSANGSGEGEIVTTLEPTSQAEGSGLRNALGIALLGAAFLVALGALWRSRRRHQEESAAVAAVEPVLFWDTRLLQLATSAVRRLAGRA